MVLASGEAGPTLVVVGDQRVVPRDKRMCDVCVGEEHTGALPWSLLALGRRKEPLVLGGGCVASSALSGGSHMVTGQEDRRTGGQGVALGQSPGYSPQDSALAGRLQSHGA